MRVSAMASHSTLKEEEEVVAEEADADKAVKEAVEEEVTRQ